MIQYCLHPFIHVLKKLSRSGADSNRAGDGGPVYLLTIHHKLSPGGIILLLLFVYQSTWIVIIFLISHII